MSFSVSLDRKTFVALWEEAIRQRRRPADQAAIIITQALSGATQPSAFVLSEDAENQLLVRVMDLVGKSLAQQDGLLREVVRQVIHQEILSNLSSSSG